MLAVIVLVTVLAVAAAPVIWAAIKSKDNEETFEAPSIIAE